MTPWDGVLPIRFVILTNEIPDIPDTSGSLTGRFVPLVTTVSFYGREDRSLFQRRLAPELSGILLWAIEGWRSLQERGHFVLPESGKDLARQFGQQGTPIAAFLADCCVLGPKKSVSKDDMYEAFKNWCERDGRTRVLTKNIFSQKLMEFGQGRITAHKPRTGPDRTQLPSYLGVGLPCTFRTNET